MAMRAVSGLWGGCKPQVLLFLKDVCFLVLFTRLFKSLTGNMFCVCVCTYCFCELLADGTVFACVSGSVVFACVFDCFAMHTSVSCYQYTIHVTFWFARR